MHSVPARVSAAIATLALSAAGCAARSSSPGPAVAVQVSTTTPRIHVGGAATFVAQVNGTSDGRVTWTVDEPAGGSIDAAGHYTAPGAAGIYHVRATSVSAPAAAGAATIGVEPPVAVSVSPSPGAAEACQQVALTATVSNGITSGAVTWTVLEGTAGGTVSPRTGTATSYVAPRSAGTYHVVAASEEDPTAVATVAVAVTERIVSVAVSPSSANLAPGETRQFTATVTTTCGSTSLVTTLTAPR